MEVKQQSEIFVIYVNKNDELSGSYDKCKLGKSPDNYYLVSIELKDKTVITFKLGDICKLASKQGSICR